MISCESVRPLLARYSEGEVTPEQAIAVARHLPDCTACRIFLARERRLASMLSEELEDFPVGEDFVRTVMATLPPDPPPRRFARRRLKLVGMAGRSR